MVSRSFKSLLVAAFSGICLFFSVGLSAQDGGPENKPDHKAENAAAGPEKAEKLNPSAIILEHVGDGHEYHFFTLGKQAVTIPLPVILYSPGKGWSFFMSSAFEHGKVPHNGYMMLEREYIGKHGLDEKVYKPGKIYALNEAGMPDPAISVYDLSLTRNVVQTMISVLLLIWLMTGVAKRYSKGHGIKTAPTGFQNAIEPIITFVRDEVGKSNLGDRYERYMPLLLTIFFFILINALIGFIPGTANVTGNIAFTGMLGLVAFIVILFSTNKHYWSHIAWPPVPIGVKPIMIPVEIMGLFTKPFALIIRLFANMISGHIIVLSFICLIFIFGAMSTGLGWGTSPFFILMAVFIYLIELLVAFIQAYIFANLTAVFIGQAFEGSHHGEHQEGTDKYDDAVIV